MKKTKFLLLVAMLLVATTLFSACGSISSVNKFLNEEYDPTEDVYNSANQVAELLDASTIVNQNDSFVIFETGEKPFVIYKVFSLSSQKVIATFTDGIAAKTLTSYSFELFDSCPVIYVKQTQFEYTTPEVQPDENPENAETPVPAEDLPVNPDENAAELEGTIGDVLNETYYIYDTTSLVKSMMYEPEEPFRLTYDTIVVDYIAYTVDTKGVLTEKVAVPEYVVLDNIDNWNDDYYYSIDSDYGVTVYDHSFNVVSTWIAPSYIYESISASVLNNGNILAQYMYEVDEDQKKYDVSICDEYTQKFDLVSLIIDAETGKAKEIELDYIVESLSSNYALNRYYTYINETSRYNDKFENIAVIIPIVNKQIDYSDSNCDIVFMNNKGKAEQSLKMIDNQYAEIPYLIGSDRYLVETLTGYAVIDAKGEVIKNMNNYLDVVGSYLVGERAIYNFDFEVVYDLAQNNAEVIDIIGNSVFVKAKNDTGYSIVLLCDGESKTIYTYNKAIVSPNTQSFEIVDDIGYVLIDITPAATNYTYYNAEGKSLISVPYRLEVVASSSAYNTILFSGTQDVHTVYVAFSINKAA